MSFTLHHSLSAFPVHEMHALAFLFICPPQHDVPVKDYQQGNQHTCTEDVHHKPVILLLFAFLPQIHLRFQTEDSLIDEAFIWQWQGCDSEISLLVILKGDYGIVEVELGFAIVLVGRLDSPKVLTLFDWEVLVVPDMVLIEDFTAVEPLVFDNNILKSNPLALIVEVHLTHSLIVVAVVHVHVVDGEHLVAGFWDRHVGEATRQLEVREPHWEQQQVVGTVRTQVVQLQMRLERQDALPEYTDRRVTGKQKVVDCHRVQRTRPLISEVKSYCVGLRVVLVRHIPREFACSVEIPDHSHQLVIGKVWHGFGDHSLEGLGSEDQRSCVITVAPSEYGQQQDELQQVHNMDIAIITQSTFYDALCYFGFG